jgi:hypothetical protein
MSTTFTIADDYDPDRDMSPNADPATQYRAYLSNVRGGMVGDMGLLWTISKSTSPGCGNLTGRKPSQP